MRISVAVVSNAFYVYWCPRMLGRNVRHSVVRTRKRLVNDRRLFTCKNTGGENRNRLALSNCRMIPGASKFTSP